MNSVQKYLSHTFLTVTIAASLSACVQQSPQPQYNVADPIQTSVDFLAGDRQYTVVDGDLKGNWLGDLLFDQKAVKLYQGSKWQQIFIPVDKANSPEVIDMRYQLEQNLARTCWGQRKDASNKALASTIRGVQNEQFINACVSDQLGFEYPLFMFGYIADPMLGDYFTLIAPTQHYFNVEYRCKLEREGYTFTTDLMCHEPQG